TGTTAAPVVTITQTQSRALLSWSSFNIGRETSLVFNQQPGWVVLNRIVSNIDPLTGQLADAGNLRPSQILGSITGAGTVLVLNQNGILFGPTSQINTHSFLASSLEIGARSKLQATSAGNVTVPTTLADRSTSFLRSGLLLSGEMLSGIAVPNGSSVVAGPQVEGAVSVASGAAIAAGTGGYVIIAAPTVSNAGAITATEGQVSLQSGRQIFAQTSSGSADSADPNVRGLLLLSATDGTTATDAVTNAATGVITATRGYVSLGTSATGTVTSGGVLAATTSVARNGKIALSGATVSVAPGGVIAVTPDAAGDTIPQGAASVAAFKHSVVTIGAAPDVNGAESGDSVTPAVVTIGANATIY
ncbi:MAG TPA: filamentous hemagglutinin N-terminal domain-containing protein, partial [Polymorphobacter sp.]|nr:filamentous hemagglutinin N-terminal domain-containing protein [Polymorphobacter sp.]